MNEESGQVTDDYHCLAPQDARMWVCRETIFDLGHFDGNFWLSYILHSYFLHNLCSHLRREEDFTRC